MKRARKIVAALVLVPGMLLGCSSLNSTFGETYTWTGSEGTTTWTVAGNWSGAGGGTSYPANSDTAKILSGTVEAANGILGQEMQIIVGDSTGGTTDAATLTTHDIRSTTTVYSNATLNVLNDFCQLGVINVEGGTLVGQKVHHLYGATINLKSGAYSTDEMRLGYNSASIVNQTGGTATISGLAKIGYNKVGTYKLDAGTLNLNGGGITAAGSFFYINNGTVNFNGGTFEMKSNNGSQFVIGNGSDAKVQLNIAAGATLKYETGADMTIGGNNSSATVAINGGTLAVSGGLINNAQSNITINKGLLQSGSFQNAGTLILNGGAVQAASLTNTGTINLSHNSTLDLGQTDFNVGGTLTMTNLQSTPQTGDLYVIAQTKDAATAQAIISAYSFPDWNLSAYNYEQGGKYYVLGTYKSAPLTEAKIWTGSTGSMADGANWTINDASLTGYVTSGTNEFTASGGKVVISGGNNSFIDGFNIAETDSITLINGSNKFNGELNIGSGSGANASLTLLAEATTISTSNKTVKIGSNGGEGTLNVSEGTVTFSQTGIIVGYNATGTGTINQTGGVLNTDKSLIVGYNGGLGSINVYDGELNVTASDFQIGCAQESSPVYSTGTIFGTVNQSGGAVKVSAWLNVGEYSSGQYNLSGGTLTANNLAVGRRGEGVLNVSGNGVLNATTLYIGMFPSLVNKAELNIQGGTVTAGQLVMGNSSNHDSIANPDENVVYRTQVSGGTLTVTGDTSVAYTGKNMPGVKAEMSISGNDTVVNMQKLIVGNGAKTEGTVNVFGGTVNIEGSTTIGSGSGVGEVNIYDGNVYFKANPSIGTGGGTGTLNISDGTVYLQCNDIYANYGGTGMINVSGGSIITNSSTWINIGENSSYKGYMTIDGGEIQSVANNGKISFLCAGRRGEGHLTINNLDAPLKVSNLLVGWSASKAGNSTYTHNGGEINIDTLTVSASNESGSNNYGTVQMTVAGGTVSVVNDMAVAVDSNALAKGILNLNGGTFKTKNALTIGSGGTAELNVTGAQAAIQIGTNLTISNISSLNGTVGASVWDSANNQIIPISTINVTRTASIAGSVVFKTSEDLGFSGLAAMSSVPTATLLKSGSLSVTKEQISVNGSGWNLNESALAGGMIQFSMDSTAFPVQTIDAAVSEVYLTSGLESGSIIIQGAPGQTVTPEFYLDGDWGDAEMSDFLSWVNEPLGATSSITWDGTRGAFSEITLDESGLGFVTWDFNAFNAEHASDLSLGKVPEPASWILLLSGLLAGLTARFRRRS